MGSSPSRASREMPKLTECYPETCSYDNLSSQNDFSIALFLALFSNEESRTKFLNFMRLNLTDNQFLFFKHIDLMTLGRSAFLLANLAENAVRSYSSFSSDSIDKCGQDFITADIFSLKQKNGSPSSKMMMLKKDEMLKSISKSLDDIILVYMMSVFPDYMLGLGSGLKPICAIKPRQLTPENCDKMLSELDKDKVNITRPMSFELLQRINNAITNIPTPKICCISSQNSWTTSLFSLLENMPCSISISSSTESDYPLIFVNSYFEKMTGYTRHEVIGKNCRFLQDMNAPENEANAILLRQSLLQQKSCRVTLTNLTKNKRKFKNLLAVKPIFDNRDKQLFVLGVQLNVTESDACVESLLFVDDLLSIFPSTIMTSY